MQHKDPSELIEITKPERVNDEPTLWEQWYAAHSVEKKLQALEGADANFLNSGFRFYPSEEYPHLFSPLMLILCHTHRAQLTQNMLHQIKTLLAVEGYDFGKKDSDRHNTLLRWALDCKQFAVAKEILLAAQAKHMLTKVLEGASQGIFRNDDPTQELFTSIAYGLFGFPELQAIEKPSHVPYILLEIEELLSFLESLLSENSLLALKGVEIKCLRNFIKAYSHYCERLEEEPTLAPQTEIELLLDLYAKAVAGLPGADNFLAQLQKLIELSRHPNNVWRPLQISQYSEKVVKICEDRAPTSFFLILGLNPFMKKALQEDFVQNNPPFFALLEEISGSFTKVCTMPVENEIIIPFIQSIINTQTEEKDKLVDRDHFPLELPLSEEDSTLLHLLTPLHKEALLWDCEEKSKKVNALLKNSPLAESTKQYIRSQVEEIHIKRRDNRLSPEEAEKFRVNMENLSLPSELKKSLATFALSIVACAILLSASALAAPAAAAVAVTSGGYSLFKGVQHQRGQEQIKTELQKPHNV
ncbi:MAG: hypothetical protein K0S27_1789, partial [Gammaproteobacteria bacterium]|nr:hypothetical protein [Gammaproteobacteria bacterium]